MISALLLIPALGGLLTFLLPRREPVVVRTVALGASALALVLGLVIFAAFDAEGSQGATYQFVESRAWIPSLGIAYKVGIDGISLFLVLLTVLLGPIVIASVPAETEHVREYMAALLLLEAAIIGVFVALDLFLFFVFWEAMLLPMYFIIGVWGSYDRIYAAIKFLIFTAAGSLCMLLAILYLYIHGGAQSFDLETLREIPLTAREQAWLFAGFALAFAIKVPMVPVHTWLPDAHVQAPTGGSVILAGVLLKMGTYGFLRFGVGLFPWAAYEAAPFLVALGLVGVIYGAFLAWAQDDLKRLVAYSSISHLGLVVVGIFSLDRSGVTGAIFQMISHGLSTGALFLLVGLLYLRRKAKLDEYGGLWRDAPSYAGILLFVTLASIGLPGLAGFVGEFLILFGAFRANPIYAVVGVGGVILGAVYMLSMTRRLLFGEACLAAPKDAHAGSGDSGTGLPHPHPLSRGERGASKEEVHVGRVADVRRVEAFYLAPIVGLLLYLGVVPGVVVDRVAPSVDSLLQQARAAHDALAATPAERLADGQP